MNVERWSCASIPISYTFFFLSFQNFPGLSGVAASSPRAMVLFCHHHGHIMLSCRFDMSFVRPASTRISFSFFYIYFRRSPLVFFYSWIVIRRDALSYYFGGMMDKVLFPLGV